MLRIDTQEENKEMNILVHKLYPFDHIDSEDFFDMEPERSSCPPEKRVHWIFEILKRKRYDLEILEQLCRVIGEYPYLFKLPGDDPSCTFLAKQQISYIDVKTIYTRQYRYPYALRGS